MSEVDPKERIAELEEEVRDLTSENARLNAVVKTELTALSWGSRLAIVLALGPRLTRSILRWIRVTKEEPGIPDVETAEVVAAVVRRLIGNRVILIVGGTFATIGGTVGAVLLYQQNRLISEQVTNQTAQLAQQVEEAETVQRSQLLALLYDRVPCSEDECPLIAGLRARTDAAKAFVGLERRRLCGSEIAQCTAGVNLSDIDLSLADFTGADLIAVTLAEANLRGTSFYAAFLRRASLVGADLSSALLNGADLEGALLNRADLNGAYLITAFLGRADLGGANLRRATLNSADFTGANLGGADLVGACATESTLWPAEDFDWEARGVVMMDMTEGVRLCSPPVRQR